MGNVHEKEPVSVVQLQDRLNALRLENMKLKKENFALRCCENCGHDDEAYRQRGIVVCDAKGCESLSLWTMKSETYRIS